MPQTKRNFADFSDEALMYLVRERNTDAFEVIYERYHHRLLVFFFRMLGRNEPKHRIFCRIFS